MKNLIMDIRVLLMVFMIFFQNLKKRFPASYLSIYFCICSNLSFKCECFI